MTNSLISVVVPALNEEKRIVATLTAIRSALGDESVEVIVVDDGSRDHTFRAAERWCDLAIRHDTNLGKGKALMSGWSSAGGDIIVFLDADLEDSARYVKILLTPIIEGEADMTIARIPGARRKGGFGLVKTVARYGIFKLSGYRADAPLSGQRAVRREVLKNISRIARGFGIEVGLTIDAVRKGYRIQEIEVPFRHRETGRDVRGFMHRGKQFAAVGLTLWEKWRHP